MTESQMETIGGPVAQVRLKGSDLAFTAWRRVYLDLKGWAPFWALFTVIAAARIWGWRLVAHGASDVTELRLRLVFYAILAGLAGGVACALTLRRFLAVKVDAAAAISGAAAYVGIVTLAGVVETLLITVTPYFATVFGLLLVALYVAVPLVFLRLVLWPIGKLTDDELTLGVAWSRMRGAMLPYLTAVLRVTLVPFIAYAVCAALYYRQGDPGLLLIGAPLQAVVNVLGLSVLAELYRARGPGRDELAAAFD